MRGTISPEEDVVIASIDDDTFVNLKANPRLFPRIATATALQKIVAAKPKAVIIDMNFPRESFDPEADQILEAALVAGPTTIWSGEMAKADPTLVGTDQFKSVSFASDVRFSRAAKMELPMWTLADNDVRSLISASTKRDASLYERVPLARPLQELAGFKINSPASNDLINFYGPESTIPQISLYRILGMDLNSATNSFKNKVVLVGYQTGGVNRGLGNKDAFEVPVSSHEMFGVEIHATIVSNLIANSWIQSVSVPNQLLIMFLATLWITWTAFMLSPGRCIMFVGLVLFASSFIAYWLFLNKSIFVPGLFTLYLAAGLIMLVTSMVNYKEFRRRFERVERSLNIRAED